MIHFLFFFTLWCSLSLNLTQSLFPFLRFPPPPTSSPSPRTRFKVSGTRKKERALPFKRTPAVLAVVSSLWRMSVFLSLIWFCSVSRALTLGFTLKDEKMRVSFCGVLAAHPLIWRKDEKWDWLFDRRKTINFTLRRLALSCCLFKPAKWIGSISISTGAIANGLQIGKSGFTAGEMIWKEVITVFQFESTKNKRFSKGLS